MIDDICDWMWRVGAVVFVLLAILGAASLWSWLAQPQRVVSAPCTTTVDWTAPQAFKNVYEMGRADALAGKPDATVKP